MTREKEIYKVTMIGGIANLLLVGFKFAAGIAGHSGIQSGTRPGHEF